MGSADVIQFYVRFCVCYVGTSSIRGAFDGHSPSVKVELRAPMHCVARHVERGDEIVSTSEAEGLCG